MKSNRKEPRFEVIPEDRTLAQQLSRSFALICGLVTLAFFIVALSYVISWAWLSPQFERNLLCIRAASAAHSSMLDEETGLRGYLATHQADFLEPYNRGESELPEANSALTACAASLPELAESLLGMRLAEERWRDRWAIPAADRRPGALAPPMSEGKALFDAYRFQQAPVMATLNRRAEALHQLDRKVQMARSVIVLALFILVLFVALRQHRSLRACIVLPVAALLDHIGRVRDGTLEATLQPEGARELRELGEGLNEMVLALITTRELSESRDRTLHEHSNHLRAILEASREFSESLKLEYVVAAVRTSTAAIGGYEAVIVWLMGNDGKRLVSVGSRAADSPSDEALEIGQGLAGRVAKSGRIAFESEAGQLRFSDGGTETVCAIAIPLIVGARIVGALEARLTEAVVPTRQSLEILEMLATHAATAIESARLFELTDALGQIDSLTRLFNRRRLDADLDAECKRCLRYGRPLALVMLDVDNFKAFNDLHGHPEADLALEEVADVLAGSVRTTDSAYRYGGEEFCILLRETGGKDAVTFAERVRQRIEHRFASGPLPGITASFGVAEFSAGMPMPRLLLEAADAAMYDSKRTGRNRVTFSSRPPFELAEGILEMIAPV
jgi:diguanylate cyclase (GGDEF)-like protein